MYSPKDDSEITDDTKLSTLLAGKWPTYRDSKNPIIRRRTPIRVVLGPVTPVQFEHKNCSSESTSSHGTLTSPIPPIQQPAISPRISGSTHTQTHKQIIDILVTPTNPCQRGLSFYFGTVLLLYSIP